MKKAFAIILLLALGFTGCANQTLTNPPSIESFQSNSNPTFSAGFTEVTQGLDYTETDDNSLPTETKSELDLSSESAEASEKPNIPSGTTHNSTAPKSNADKPKESSGTVTTAPAQAETAPPVPTETIPTEPEATESETESTEPPTNPTVPPTEPTGCTHEWKCIHHSEEGHWRAGIICDCGWTVYGNPSELTSLWNAHSASFPPAESLFVHGGFGSMDKWIVDKPAYDEWLCRHCGKLKE